MKEHLETRFKDLDERLDRLRKERGKNDHPFELNGLDPEYEGRFGESTYKVVCTDMSERFIKALAEAHDSITTYGKAGVEEDTSELHDLDYLGNETVEPMIRVLVIQENCGEPGDDFIVNYNYKGVMRMTGLMSDSHCHLSVYKVSDDQPQGTVLITDPTEASHLTLEDI